MYDFVKNIAERPAPFSCYTAKTLWTRPHLSRQMLKYHLDQDTDLASRRFEVIDQAVNWIDRHLNLENKHVCDLGCGPGLYAERFSNRGAMVTGVDFSETALEHAQKATSDDIRYIKADYLDDTLPKGFDLVTLIYTDLCALSPNQRAILLGKMHEMLNPGGHIVLDVAGPGLFQQRQEVTLIENQLMGGFWAAGDYVGIQRSFNYEERLLALDRYIIIEPGETWHVYNWFQHFTPEKIETELNNSGFEVAEMAGDLCGNKLDPAGDLIGIIARPVA